MGIGQNSAKKPSFSNEISFKDASILRELISKYQKKYKSSVEEIIESVYAPKIPISIFDNDLSCFEAVVKYSRENLNLQNSEIAEIVSRSPNSITTTYNNAKGKLKSKIFTKEEKSFPLNILAKRKLSVLENVCMYLRKSYGMSNKEIGNYLNLDNRTIWTVIDRARKKIE